MNTDNYDMDLTARQNLIKTNQKHMVEVARLEKLVDEAFFTIGQYKNFLDYMEKKYPLVVNEARLDFNL